MQRDLAVLVESQLVEEGKVLGLKTDEEVKAFAKAESPLRVQRLVSQYEERKSHMKPALRSPPSSSSLVASVGLCSSHPLPLCCSCRPFAVECSPLDGRGLAPLQVYVHYQSHMMRI